MCHSSERPGPGASAGAFALPRCALQGGCDEGLDDGLMSVLMPKLTKILMNVNNYVDLDQDFNLRNKRSRRRRYRIVSWSSSRRCSRSKLEPR